MPSNPLISQITLPNGNTYDLKDAYARDRLGELTKALYWIGVTTTQLVDDVTTSPDIVVGGETITATAGGVAQYDGEEFVYNGTKWQSLGSAVSGLGALAYKDSASGSYTPAGSVTLSNTGGATTLEVSKAATGTATYTPEGSVSGSVSGTSVSVGSTTVSEVTNAGSMPSYSVSSETLTITAGAVPTVSSKTVGASGAATVTEGTFSGSFSGTGARLTASVTIPDTGSFSGTAATITVS